MLTLLIALKTILVLSLAARATLRLTAWHVVFSPCVVYLIFYVLFHYPLLFYVGEAQLEYMLAIDLGLFGFIVGMYLVMHGTSPHRLRQTQLKTPVAASPAPLAMIMLILGILVTLLMFRGLPPSLEIFIKFLKGQNVYGDLIGMSNVRQTLTKSHYFGGEYRGQGILKSFNEVIWQTLAVFFYVRAIQLRSRLGWLQFAGVTLAAALMIMGAGAKGPVAFILIAIIVAQSYVAKIPLARLQRYSLLLFMMLFVIQMTQVSRFSVEQGIYSGAFEALVRRIISGNGQNTYSIVQLIQMGEIDYRYGYDHLTKFMNTIPGIQFDTPFAHQLYLIVSDNVKYGKTIYYSYTYLGSAFLDFGYVGAFVLSMLTGMLLQYIYRVMLSLPRSTFTVAINAVFSVTLGGIAAGSLMSLHATVFVFVVFIGVLLSLQALATGSRQSKLRRVTS